MTSDALPSSVTDKIYRAPYADRLSQNDVKALLAHFWPAIAEHFAREVYTLKAQLPTGSEHYQAGWDTAIEAAADTIRNQT